MFDGLTWRQDPRQRSEDPTNQLPDDVANQERWSQRIEVTLRNIRTDTFVTAGIATAVNGEDGYPIGGGIYNATTRLGRGDAYSADVYTPRPEERELREAGTSYEDWLRGYLSLFVPARPGVDPQVDLQLDRVDFPRLGRDREAGDRAVRRRPAEGRPAAPPQRARARVGAVARAQGGCRHAVRVRRRRSSATSTPASPTPSARRRRPGRSTASCSTPRSASASSTPAPRRCCCGWPASRPGSPPGFTTGAFDEKEKEYVVRDLDAHSWVEAWFPGIGWVTRDPTPAAAPARSQPGDNRSELPNAGNQTAPDLGGERLSDLESNRSLAPDEGVSTLTWILFGIAAALIMTVAVLLQRRHDRAPPAARGATARRLRARAGARAVSTGPTASRCGLERASAAGRAPPATSARCASALLGPPGAADRRAAPRAARGARPRGRDVRGRGGPLPPKRG